MRARLLVFLVLAVAASAQAFDGRTVGVLRSEVGSSGGYTLIAPSASTTTYLIESARGRVVRTWESEYVPGAVAYLLPTGELLRTGRQRGGPFQGGGIGGRIERFSWGGDLEWSFEYADAQVHHHHDVEWLPNGNLLLVAWEMRSAAAAVAAGRDPARILQGALWPDHVVEIEPAGATGGTVVWEWHVWDHLIQDHDPTKANFGVVAAHPELVDVNAGGALADWLHVNSVDYHPQLDQILISVHNLDEIWVIDHSTTTAEAAGHAGGRSGKGGDLLYRWGNPAVHRAGSDADRQLFGQHDASWIEPGLPGASSVLLFNNGVGRPQGLYSTVVELVPPTPDANGVYPLEPGVPAGPAAPAWEYVAPEPGALLSLIGSGAQRLANGNTLVCEGVAGRILELDAAEQVVWEYLNPARADGPMVQGVEATGSSPLFRANRYGPDFPGFEGRLLDPGDPIELYTAAPVAAFELGAASVEAGRPLAAHDRSTGFPATWRWSFGDGGTSVDVRPVHVFARAGRYRIELVVENPRGESAASLEVEVTGALFTDGFELGSTAVWDEAVAAEPG